MSTSARLNAAGAWKSKYKDIIQAQARRAIPREELAEMPKISDVATVEYNKNPNGVSAMVLCENDTDDMPSLVNESEDESGADDKWETSSSTSSVDSAMGFFQSRFTADEDKDLASTAAGEDTDSNHSENSDCHVCLKPRWCSAFNPSTHHCRDYCLHKYNTVDSTTTNPAPIMEKTTSPPPNHNFAMAMMPEDVEEIAARYKHGDYSAPTEPPPEPHREKEHPQGD